MLAKHKFIENGRTTKSRIIRYKTEGDIVLESHEELSLLRWEYADELYRMRKTEDEIVEALRTRFGVSTHRAHLDMRSAQDVFARSRSINKKYVGHLHLQRIERMINFVEKKYYENKKQPDSKELSALTKLYESYTYTLNALPEDKENRDPKPTIIVCAPVSGQSIVTDVSFEDAMNDDLDEKEQDDSDYIDHEAIENHEWGEYCQYRNAHPAL